MTSLTVQPTGQIEGYASVFHIIDSGGDSIKKGAFQNSLQEQSHGISMLYQHNPERPIGVWEEIKEDSYGLKVKGRLTLENSDAKDIYALVRAGAITGLSIGYKPVTVKRDASGIRYLEAVKLIEVSIVTFPMNEKARIESHKRSPKQSLLAQKNTSWVKAFSQTLKHAQDILNDGYN